MARAVRGVFQPCRAARGVSSLPARTAERQSPQVDERDARARQRSRHRSIVSALHHRCALECRWGLQQLRAVIPERRGVLILDGTSFPKQGRRSVAVARQYCGTLGQVANCQVAVTAALWTGVRAWMLGAALYVPEEWLTPEARARARIPAPVRFQEKWRLALTLLRQIRAAGFDVTAVLGDAEFGATATLRRPLHRLHPPYALGLPSTLTVFRGRPRVAVPPRKAGVRTSRRL